MNGVLPLVVCLACACSTLLVTAEQVSALPGLTDPLACGPVCAIHCSYGNVLDSRGCPTCRCNMGPSCPKGTKQTGRRCSGFTLPGTDQCGPDAFCVGGAADDGVCCRKLWRPILIDTCPPPSPYPGICIFVPGVNCLSDAECGKNQRCCSEGCGKVCKNVLGSTYPGITSLPTQYPVA